MRKYIANTIGIVDIFNAILNLLLISVNKRFVLLYKTPKKFKFANHLFDVHLDYALISYLRTLIRKKVRVKCSTLKCERVKLFQTQLSVPEFRQYSFQKDPITNLTVTKLVWRILTQVTESLTAMLINGITTFAELNLIAILKRMFQVILLYHNCLYIYVT